jgi:hypothetical protein
MEEEVQVIWLPEAADMDFIFQPLLRRSYYEWAKVYYELLCRDL